MENLKNELRKAGILPRFGIRYGDVPAIAIIKREETDDARKTQLGTQKRNKIEKEGAISFPDVKIIRGRGHFEFDIYRTTQTQRTSMITATARRHITS